MVLISSPAAPAAGLMRLLPAPAGDPGQDLPGMDDRELLALAASLPPVKRPAGSSAGPARQPLPGPGAVVRKAVLGYA